MRRNPIPTALLMLLPLSLQAEEISTFTSVTGRHIEHKGIGYDDGYSSLDIFLAATPGRCVLFTDLRGHVFNDGRFAGNAGVGVRAGICDTTFGLNGFFDIREYPRNSVEKGALYRIGGGVEVLTSNCFEFRVNGYLPVGNSKRVDPAEFAFFQGNNAIAEELGIAALPSIDAELGYTFRPGCCGVEIYAGVMPYYLFRRKWTEHDHFGQEFGGKGRLAATVFDMVNLEVTYSYDRIYHSRVQGQVGFSIPFGFFCGQDCSPCTDVYVSSCVPKYLRKVRREEIIPLEEKVNRFAILDPSTNSPFNFLFVDNSAIGTGTGTFENPFSVLGSAEAASVQRDIIYVQYGDGTNFNQDTGIVLQNFQKLIGSAANFTLNNIAIPAQTPDLFPIISNTGNPAIELNMNNEVAGFRLLGDGTGIEQTSGSFANYFIHHNWITTAGSTLNIEVSDNSVVRVENNLLENTGGSSTTFFDLESGSFLSMLSNTITNTGGAAESVLIDSDNSNVAFENNVFDLQFFMNVAGTSASGLRALNNVRSDFSVSDAYFLLNNVAQPLFLVEVPNPATGAASFESVNSGTLNIPSPVTFVKLNKVVPE